MQETLRKNTIKQDGISFIAYKVEQNDRIFPYDFTGWAGTHDTWSMELIKFKNPAASQNHHVLGPAKNLRSGLE